ncbi:hypothetical protein LPC08_23875 [Roseomonas sp. OT10]|nr:hypothetical protein LPC08_23875 [Roseomonas sp. OT10]
MLNLGDISAARLLFSRAAQAGLRAAMTGMGKTYDPLFLGSIGARTDLADRAEAAAWYRRAIAQGDAEAPWLLRWIESAPPR